MENLKNDLKANIKLAIEFNDYFEIPKDIVRFLAKSWKYISWRRMMKSKWGYKA